MLPHSLLLYISLERFVPRSGFCADFTTLSFYKIFGFPDLGGLIVRKMSGKILPLFFWEKVFWRRNGFIGNGFGQQAMVQVSRSATRKFEVHNIALSTAIDTPKRLYGSDPMETIRRHTSFPGKRLYDSLTSLRHSDGVSVCQVYGKFLWR